MQRFATRRTEIWLVATLLCATLLGSGCHSFRGEWRRVGRKPATTSPLEGRWDGQWLSAANGHSGKLRCIVTANDDGTYHARFHAKYQRILSFGYTVQLKAEPTDAGMKFQGEANLGWLAGGEYHYEGRADGTNYLSTYSSKYDHGNFSMIKVPPGRHR